jgi:large subunit ribosomal protein L30
MAELTVKQIRSANGISPSQRATLRTLKLGRIGSSSVRTDGPELRGMLDKVGHLVEVKEGKE